VHGSDGNAELIDSGSVNLGKSNSHVVVILLLDTGNACCGITVFYSGGRIVVINFLVHNLGENYACGLSLHSGEYPAVLLANSHCEVFNGSVFLETVKSPVSCCAGNVARFIGTGFYTVVNDSLSEGNETLVECLPESSLLLSGNDGEISLVSADHREVLRKSGHTCTVLIHALDRNSKQSGAAVVGRIAKYVHAEDYVINGNRLAVGEGHSLTELESVGNGSVIVFGDRAVRSTGIGIGVTVVLPGLAFDAFHDDSALTVISEKTDLGQLHNVLVISGLRKEGRKLFVECGITDNQRGKILLTLFYRCRGSRTVIGACGILVAVAFAAGEHSETHDCSKKQCECSFHGYILLFLFFA